MTFRDSNAAKDKAPTVDTRETGARTPTTKRRSPQATIGKILAAYRGKRLGPLAECRRLLNRVGRADLIQLLDELPSVWADHAIASVYALLMSHRRRKRLGAYFTPPPLVDHLVKRLCGFGLDLVNHRLRDPAAGGAAFLVPLARLKVMAWRAEGASDAEVVARLASHLVGREIDANLAALANALVRRMLRDEFCFPARLVRKVALVRVGDSLKEAVAKKDTIDHEIGNPPFRRLSGRASEASRRLFREISSSRLNLYAMFIRRALEEVPVAGLVGYVVPASFLGGPEFETFRRRIVQVADVLAIDVIDNRRDVFLDAIQDACFLVLRRRQVAVEGAVATEASSGVVQPDGTFSLVGEAQVPSDGSPWQLPGAMGRHSTIREWGYRGTIGYLVANRQEKRLHKRRAKGRYPLIWAKAISSDGGFDFERGARSKGKGWVDAPPDAPYVVRRACVVVQRTSARSQKRRINAAIIPDAFIMRHGGIIGENHVIFLIPTDAANVCLEALAEALNDRSASIELNRVCGSASISVRLLEDLPLRRVDLECASPQPITLQSLPRAAMGFTSSGSGTRSRDSLTTGKLSSP